MMLMGLIDLLKVVRQRIRTVFPEILLGAFFILGGRAIILAMMTGVVCLHPKGTFVCTSFGDDPGSFVTVLALLSTLVFVLPIAVYRSYRRHH